MSFDPHSHVMNAIELKPGVWLDKTTGEGENTVYNVKSAKSRHSIPMKGLNTPALCDAKLLQAFKVLGVEE